MALRGASFIDTNFIDRRSSGDTRPLTDDESSLLNEWYRKVIVYNLAHLKTKKRYEFIKFVLGLVATTFPVCAIICANTLAPKFAVLVSLVAAVAVACDGRMHPAYVAYRNHLAQIQWRSLENKIKGMFAYEEVRNVEESITEIRRKYGEIMSSSPILPADIIRSTEAVTVTETLGPKQISLPTQQLHRQIPFNNDEVRKLKVRMDTARRNRQAVIIKAELYDRCCDAFGALAAVAAVMSTSLYFTAFLGDAPNWCLHFGTISNLSISALAIIDGKGGFSAKTKELHNIATRWSCLGREIQQALSHPDPNRDGYSEFAYLEQKYSDFVDELFKGGHDEAFVSRHEANNRNEVGAGFLQSLIDRRNSMVSNPGGNEAYQPLSARV